MIADSVSEDAALSGRSRRSARRQAVILLYQRDVTELGISELVENVERTGASVNRFTRDLLHAVDEHLEELDGLINDAAIDWTVDRLAPLERNILRVASLELRHSPDIPNAVAIDEAVRLAKRYCQPEAASLVNGILARLVDEDVARA
jgi:N utilization substance protein B